MAATLLARYSTTQRLSGSCSGQLRPAAVMAVVMGVLEAMISMVCPTAW